MYVCRTFVLQVNTDVAQETLASFLDLEAEVNDEEEEGLDDGSDDELDGAYSSFSFHRRIESLLSRRFSR